ncbi:inositol monophosphatase [Ligilactobacillus salitolerans]|uniref:Inositol monophosphatase n=1 Tax=Ligilactobacillus salitolerans TaxID=1808352 RepID=A0A401IQW7_9LACO|nr:inositol monophosphatase family protein [Ligilactobacillus salitolerans]GBG93921.1 inositol monophosphatase [Ligilactobacillus salitolerans]
MTDQLELHEKISSWFHSARDQILNSKQTGLNVDYKTSRLDLVTNMDRGIEKFYREKIRENFPDSNIMGEEGQKDEFRSSQGLFWVIDPIDGTMNFVKQGTHFASMIAVYQDQKPLLGYIYDVINDHLYWGGPGLGVYRDDQKLTAPMDLALADGLLGVNGAMLMHNYRNVQTAVKQSAGARIYGSAGIEFIHVLQGQCVGYLSHLRPWDYAAGAILAESLNLIVKTIDGQPLGMVESEDVLVATPQAYRQITGIMTAES